MESCLYPMAQGFIRNEPQLRMVAWRSEEKRDAHFPCLDPFQQMRGPVMSGHSWRDLSRSDFAGIDRSRAICVLPVGAIEQHGPHLPVSVDSDLVEAVVARALPQVSGDVTAVALPCLTYGKSNEHGAIPGTLSLSAATLLAMLSDIGASLARTGFRRLVLLNGHGGNNAVLDIAARDMKIAYGLSIFTCHWYSFNEASSLTDAHEDTFGIHAGLVETSAMLAIEPARVDMGKAANFPNKAEDWQRDFGQIGMTGGRAKPAWVIDDLNAQGACGNAVAATPGLGETLLANAARNFAAFLAEVDRFCNAAEKED